ncbi:MAG: S-methyl-5-thioribose-1-phosphate isomerase [Desulfovibrio sp.]|jgi:methylthioribose-1-phosphate isomerase|nr:S-methyl-5-thioribose-1-phosphate isomerase [Desulfovibrio sp.]
MEHHIRYDAAQRALILLDQRLLPTRQEDFVCRTTEDIVTALQVMVVRGAPAIGVTAAWGCVLAAYEAAEAGDHWHPVLDGLLERIAAARPTAVNLRWAVDRMRKVWKTAGHAPFATLISLWESEARRIHRDDIEINRAMGRHGAALIDEGDTVMTHCNAGALATAGYGTALGVIRGAVDAGKKIAVIANETRPFLQGARLTAYELHEDHIPVTVACDNACGHLMRKGMVQKVVVGADRIAANGDAANKIGTYSVALLAREHGVPFYVAAPLSTIDRNTPDGDHIPIEDRTPREVTHVGDTQITPDGVPVYNFAFDVTPAALIAGIVTEVGVLRAPYTESIAEAFRKAGLE